LLTQILYTRSLAFTNSNSVELGTTELWDIQTGLRLTNKLGPVKEGSQRAALAPDCKSMAVIRYIDAPQSFICELVRFDANEVVKLPVSTIDSMYRLEAIAYSPDGKTVAASGIVSKKGDWLVLIWDTSVQPIRVYYFRWWMPGDPGGLETTKLAFSSDGRYLATGHYFNTVRIIEVNTNKVIRNMAGGGGPMLFLNRPLATLLVSDVKRLYLWSPPMPDMKIIYQSKVPLVLCMAAHPNGHTIALGGYGETNVDGEVRIEGNPHGMIEIFDVKDNPPGEMMDREGGAEKGTGGKGDCAKRLGKGGQ